MGGCAETHRCCSKQSTIIKTCTKTQLRRRIIHSPVLMGCARSQEDKNKSENELAMDVDEIDGNSSNKHRQTDEPGSPKSQRSNQGECESPRAPRPMKHKQRSSPDSPRAPRPGQRPSLSVDTDDEDTDAIDTAEILTQVSRGPPSPGIASPRSTETKQQMVSGQPALLPPRPQAMEGKRTLCLDLDECLVHAEREEPDRFDYEIDVQVRGLGNFKIFFTKRPGLDKFLKYVSENFELALFTASMEEYAKAVLEKIDPDGLIPHVLARKQCTFHEEEYYVKDLSRLGRPIRDVMLLDDNPNAYLFQPENAIPINSWYDDQSDTELAEVQVLLDAILKSERSCVTTLEQMDNMLKWNRAGLHQSRKWIKLS